jgi:hypothetical protein
MAAAMAGVGAVVCADTVRGYFVTKIVWRVKYIWWI